MSVPPRNTFCKTVWDGLHILPDGYIRLCSLGTNSVDELDMQRCRDKDGNLMHILTHDLRDIINSDKHREVRRLNVKSPDQWSPHCECCENREIITDYNRNHVNTSRRVRLMTLINSEHVTEEDYTNKIADDGSVDWLPSSLDIRFGNLCNQKCIMCGPHFSNLWYDEYTEYYNTNSFGLMNEIKLVKNIKTDKWMSPPEMYWYENPIWWEKFNQLMPGLRHIYITGGEPMVTPAHFEMLEKLSTSGYSKNVVLEYDTNLSALNNKIIDQWSNFKSVIVRVSMDATGDQYELIRFGGKWEKFVENVKTLKKHTLRNPNVVFDSITSCFQTLTAYDIIKSEEFCRRLGIPFHIRFLEGPIHFSVNHLPRDLKLKLLEYYRSFVNVSLKSKLIVAHLKNNLETEIDPNALQEFIKFMDYLDKSRNTNWRAVLPEVSQLVG